MGLHVILYNCIFIHVQKSEVMSRRAWVLCEAYGVSLSGTTFSVDLGGSSNFKNKNVGDRSGEGFPENSNWSGVTRS